MIKIKKNSIICLDIKSFYASIECLDRNLNPYTTPLVVADKERGPGTIILAVAPYLKTLGIPSRLRVYQLPKIDGIIFARPRMKRYLEVSAMVNSIFLDYVSQSDLHIYSIDESFLDVTHYLKAYKCEAVDLARTIKAKVKEKLGLDLTAGIAENLFLAKVAMDNEAKKNKEQIADWSNIDALARLHSIYPLSKIWGIGSQLEKRLNSIGFFTMKDIFNAPKKILTDAFGVIGGELHDHAHGIDLSVISDKYQSSDPSISLSQVLHKDYNIKDIPIVIKEICDELVLKMIYQKKACKTVSLYIGYSKEVGGGFVRQTQLEVYSSDYYTILHAVMYLFKRNIKNQPIRKLGITLSKLIRIDYFQPHLFTPIKEQEKQFNLQITIAKIKSKYGNTSLLKLSDLKEQATTLERQDLIGGHHK